MWIPTLLARPARSNVPVINPRMTVNDFIKEGSNKWDVEMFENFASTNDIPNIKSLVISQNNHRDTFCWS